MRRIKFEIALFVGLLAHHLMVWAVGEKNAAIFNSKATNKELKKIVRVVLKKGGEE